MIFFRKIGNKLSHLDFALKASFVNVKKDTHLIFQWLNYLNQKTIAQDKLITELKKELFYLPKKEDIRRLIDEHYTIEPILARIRNIEETISKFSRPLTDTDDFKIIKKRLEKIEEKKLNLKEKLIKRITKHSKDYVKSVIVSLIKKYEKISSMHLRDIVVEEQGLCSKSSFYRLLEELEALDEVAIIKKGKEKHYLYKLEKKL